MQQNNNNNNQKRKKFDFMFFIIVILAIIGVSMLIRGFTNRGPKQIDSTTFITMVEENKIAGNVTATPAGGDNTGLYEIKGQYDSNDDGKMDSEFSVIVTYDISSTTITSRPNTFGFSPFTVTLPVEAVPLYDETLMYSIVQGISIYFNKSDIKGRHPFNKPINIGSLPSKSWEIWVPNLLTISFISTSETLIFLISLIIFFPHIQNIYLLYLIDQILN